MDPGAPYAYQGIPGHLLLLSDGRLLVTYGHRRAPCGIRACLSQDEGQTWDYEKELLIRGDMPNKNLGYPVSIEYEPGRTSPSTMANKKEMVPEKLLAMVSAVSGEPTGKWPELTC